MQMLLGVLQHVVLTTQQAVLGAGNLRKQGVVMWTGIHIAQNRVQQLPVRDMKRNLRFTERHGISWLPQK